MTPASSPCPRCGKPVQLLPNGKGPRPHAVPIENRRDPKKAERCQ